MITAYTLHRERSAPLLRRLADVRGVRHVVVLDAAGLCLAHAGHEPVSNALLGEWTIVARTAFAAGEEIGQRSGAGPCLETVQTHHEGGVLMRAIAGGMVLLAQYDSSAHVGTVRLTAAEIVVELPTPVEARPLLQPVMPAASAPLSRPAPAMAQRGQVVLVDG